MRTESRETIVKMRDAELLKLAAETVMQAEPKPMRWLGDEFVGSEYDFGRDDRRGRKWLHLYTPESPYIHKIEGWNPLESDEDAFMIVDAMLTRGYCFSMDEVVDGARVTFKCGCPEPCDRHGEVGRVWGKVTPKCGHSAVRRRGIVIGAVMTVAGEPPR